MALPEVSFQDSFLILQRPPLAYANCRASFFEFIFTNFEQPNHHCQICFILELQFENRLGRPIPLLCPSFVPVNILVKFIRYHLLWISDECHNVIDRKSLKTASGVISDLAFEFHLPWNEHFAVSGG